MPHQTLEYPWNGLSVLGALPSGGLGTFLADPNVRDIDRVRVLLDPRVVMPVGTTTIPAAVQTALLEIADGAQQGSNYPVNVGIEWCLGSATWPTSATVSRRPWLSDLTTFWGAMDDLLGDHAATWGFSLLNNPTFAQTGPANSDPAAAMVTWANMTWTGGTDPTTTDHQAACRWLEAITTEVRNHLRTSKLFAKNIVVPTMYNRAHLRRIGEYHPGGPWVNDANVWYETSFYPAGLDQTQVKSAYSVYNDWAATVGTTYRASWLESAYFNAGAGVIDPDPLALPAQDALPPDPNEPQATPPLAPVLTSVTASDAAVSVAWSEPTYNGGAQITSYVVTATSASDTRTVTVAAEVLAVTVAPLTNDTAYTFSVVAANSAGTSEPSNTMTATPAAGLPPVDPPPPDEPDVPVEDEPVVVPQPLMSAFVVDGDFIPSNWIAS